MAATLTWVKDSTRESITVVSPTRRVRVVVPASMPDDAEIHVFAIPESALRRVLRKLVGAEPGRNVQTLWIDKGRTLDGRKLSRTWTANNLKISLKAAQFVARTSGAKVSAPLFVAPKMRVVMTNPEFEAGAAIDTAQFGVPASAKVSLKNGRLYVETEFFAPADPTFSVRVLTPSSSPSLTGYLGTYLNEAAQAYGAPSAAAFVTAFREEFAEYLANTPDVRGEILVQQPIELASGDSITVGTNLFVRESGRTMFAFAAIDPDTERLIAVSELIGLTVASPQEAQRDF